VEVLESYGKYSDALTILERAAGAFPEEAIFQHKLSVLKQNLGETEKAYEHAINAYHLDRTLPEAVLHLASLELKNGNPKEAKRLISELPSQLPYRASIICDTVKAEIMIVEKEYANARALINKHDYLSDTYLADAMARIELAQAMDATSKKNYKLACGHLKKGKSVVKNALTRFPENKPLQFTLEQIEKMITEFC